MFLKNNNFGGILADDMGLGKTVQTLAYLHKLHSNHNPNNLCSLLVVPTSLAYNWKNQAGQFTHELKTHIHGGQNRLNKMKQFKGADIVITSYGLIRNDFDLLADMEFLTIVLDESQNIKNRGSQTAQAVKKLKANYRLCLTGTPIENSVTDLWSQMDFINPKLLGSFKQFEQEYVKPIERDKEEEVAQKLQQLIKPFVLRRTKHDVAKELPPLTEKVIYCDMLPGQLEHYEETKSAYRNAILSLVQEQGLNKSKMNVLQGLTKMRQIANHPRLEDAESDLESGKHNAVLEHLKTVLDEQHKVLIFSQFTTYLDILSAELDSLGIAYYKLTGSTTKEQRAKLVDNFQQEEQVKVFLISLKAGGTGLNLTAADYVFLVDPWWNPAVEAQARDRSHRIGQTANVFSYKFITKDTIEEKIIKLQARKQKVAKDLISIENNVLKNLDITEIKALFG